MENLRALTMVLVSLPALWAAAAACSSSSPGNPGTTDGGPDAAAPTEAGADDASGTSPEPDANMTVADAADGAMAGGAPSLDPSFGTNGVASEPSRCAARRRTTRAS